MAQPIGTLGTIPTLTVGGRVFTDLDNLITLVAQEGASATSQNCTFRKVGVTGGYVVPALTTFKLIAIKIVSVTATAGANANGNLDILYADNDVGFGTNTAFTNPVYLGGDSSSVVRFQSLIATGQSSEFVINFDIPAGKYPAIAGQFAVTGQEDMVIAYGYEVV